MHASVAIAVAPTLFALAAPAHAQQGSAAVTVGGGVASLGDREAGVFHLGVRGDLLFLRTRDREMGVGPFLAVGSEAFRTVSFEGGLDWLVPAWVDFPFTFAMGGFGRVDDARVRVGALGEVLWGSRGHNFDGPYDLSFNLFAEGRYAPGPISEYDAIGGVAIDLSVFAYPILLVWGALAR